MVEIESGGGATVIENALDAVCEPLSATLTVKVKLPAVVGAPPITPAGDNESPAGKDPEARDQVYGGAPLAAARVAE